MKAQLITSLGEITPDSSPLELKEIPRPRPGRGQIRLKITACGVCHTELDEIEGRTPPPELPVIPGHQVVGTIDEFGPEIDPTLQEQLNNQPIGVGWIYSACGQCRHCRENRENLCPDFTATGRDRDGGYAEYMIVPVNYAIPLPPGLDPLQAAPLLCAGSIGYRSLRLALSATHLHQKDPNQKQKAFNQYQETPNHQKETTRPNQEVSNQQKKPSRPHQEAPDQQESAPNSHQKIRNPDQQPSNPISSTRGPQSPERNLQI